MLYSKTHEWVKIKEDLATIGISDHAQGELSDVVYIDLPKIGKILKKGEVFMSIESVKAASDIYAPIDGSIVEINQTLLENPEKVNESPEDHGWLVKVKIDSSSQTNELLSLEDYKKKIAEG